MALSFPMRRPLAALLVAAGALPACQQICPANASPPPVFTLAFSTDIAKSSGFGFHRTEVRSAYLVHYGTADFQQPTDTLRQPAPATPLNSTRPVLAIYYGAGEPPQFAVPDYDNQQRALSYRLVVPAANRTFDISNVVLKQEPGKDRCDGYRLTRREATVNGQLRDDVNTPPVLTR